MATRTVVSLNDRHIWKYRQADSPASEWMGVRDMPTNIHLDLLHNGIISNPSIGKRENDCQWVGEKSWVYRATFPAPTVSPGEQAVLAFDGLDTFATIVLNSKEILKTKDMFIPERVMVTNIIRPEENILEITFDSTYLIGKKFVEQHPNHRWGCVRIFGVHISSFEPSVDSRDMSWGCSLSRHVLKLITLPQTSN